MTGSIRIADRPPRWGQVPILNEKAIAEVFKWQMKNVK